MKALLPDSARPLLEAQLPADLEIYWFAGFTDAAARIIDADIAWVDTLSRQDMNAVASRGIKLKWLFTMYAGVDAFDLDELAARGTMLTNGAGINAAAVADYAALAILAAAKRFDQVVRLVDRRQWTTTPPGSTELEGTRALVLGYGSIGRRIGTRLEAFGIEVTGVTRTGGAGTMPTNAWRKRVGEYDWVVLSTPATRETRHLLGAAEIATMKPGAWLINMARGQVVDQEALIKALRMKRIGGAFLDTVTPEPLPPDHPLWSAPNVIMSLHLSGRSQRSMFERGARLFLENLDAFQSMKDMSNIVDLSLGY